MNMKSALLFFLAIVLVSLEAIAQVAPVDSVIEGNINSNAFLTKSKRYLLRGFVNVNPPATLTIEPGTIIYGEQVSKGTLIINRGAKIIADGTKQNPIVFTSQFLPGNRNAGDWGGIIIAGNASINVPGGTATIEGGTGTVYGGGATPNDDDNSGVLRYIRLEFSGIAFLPDNEINGLTLGGVGRGTIIEYFQVSYNGDDSFEWFGGTVNAKYLISLGAIDDDFDTDLGFNGNIQFGLVIRDPNFADISGSNGFETDNDPTGTFNNPRTRPIFSNITVIGPMADTSATGWNPNFRRGGHLRRSTQTSIYNSIVMGFPVGLFIDGAGSANSALGDTLQIRNSIWAGLRANNGIITNQASFDVLGWYDTPSFGNRRYVQPSEVGLINPFNVNSPNPVPGAGSVAATGASFANPRLMTPFFSATNYVGAFDPNGPRWDEGWTNYDPQNTDYVTSVDEKELAVISDYKLSQNYPNPFNPTTNIIYTVSEPGMVKLSIYNILGQEVKNLVNGYRAVGSYEVTFDAVDLPTGVYVYKLEAGSTILSKKMTLLK